MLTLTGSYEVNQTGINSGLITSNNACLVEIDNINLIPENWYKLGYLTVVIEDEDLGNRSPRVDDFSLSRDGYLYIPNFNLDYRILYYPKVWLLKISPIPTINFYSVNDIVSCNTSNNNSVTSNDIQEIQISDIETVILQPSDIRHSFLIRNTGNQRIWIKLGTGVTRNNYHYSINDNESLELNVPYGGIVTGICRNNRTSTIEGIEFINGG